MTYEEESQWIRRIEDVIYDAGQITTVKGKAELIFHEIVKPYASKEKGWYNETMKRWWPDMSYHCDVCKVTVQNKAKHLWEKHPI